MAECDMASLVAARSGEEYWAIWAWIDALVASRCSRTCRRVSSRPGFNRFRRDPESREVPHFAQKRARLLFLLPHYPHFIADPPRIRVYVAAADRGSEL